MFEKCEKIGVLMFGVDVEEICLEVLWVVSVVKIDMVDIYNFVFFIDVCV